MRVQESTTINVPPETVFAYVSDPEKSQRWDQSLVEVKVLTNGPFGLGTRVREVRESPAVRTPPSKRLPTLTIPAAEMGWTTVEGEMDSTGSITVEPQGDGSRVVFEMSGRGNAFMTVLSPLISWSVGREVRRNLQALKSLAEAPQETGTPEPSPAAGP
ncbi:MAG: SRPBCC family protein [Dehalococcoidia bacterium]|nr:SRPBCC family protein [Dehalococcoidia bacterium]